MHRGRDVTPKEKKKEETKKVGIKARKPLSLIRK
jgi:hypothetical protein